MNNNLFNIFYSFSHVPLLAKFFVFISYPFTYGLIAVAVILAIFFSKRKFYNFSLISLSLLSSWLVASMIKNILKIDRPYKTEHIMPLVKESGFSFPSEHAAVAMSLVIVAFFIDKRLGVLAFFLALLIGISRIVLGVHYPSDILGGYVVGFVITMIIIQIYKKI